MSKPTSPLIFNFHFPTATQFYKQHTTSTNKQHYVEALLTVRSDREQGID